MALPKLNTPKFKMKLPSDGRTVNFRPFLVKEEKLLLLATESGESSELIAAVTDIIKSCTDIQDVDKLPTFDIEYIFLQIRTKSVGETVEVNVTCPDDGVTQIQMEIDIDAIKVEKNPDHTDIIKLDDDLSVKMGYPSMTQFIETNFEVDTNKPQVDQSLEIIMQCIDQVYTAEESWDASDCTKKELRDFVESMNSKQFKDIEKFFDTMPKLQHKIEITNPKTKVKSSVMLEGLASFFA